MGTFMNFNKQLNEYISMAECSSKDLANKSGLSPTVISRYRNGERTPNIRSKQLDSLTEGIYQLLVEKKIKIEKDEIYRNLSISLNDVNIELDQLINNFNELIRILNINIAELSRKIGYDSSYISKLRTGNILPSKPQIFINEVSNFIVTKYNIIINKLHSR